MRVLHYLSGLDPSGAARSGVLLARGLAQRGHTCRVACGRPGPLARELAEGRVPVVEAEPRRPRLLGWRIPAFAAALAEEPPDLIHLNNLCLEGPALARVARRSGVPLVWHVREDPGSRRARRLRRSLLRHARRVIAVSEQIRRGLGNGEPDRRVLVVPNGIDPGPDPDRDSARGACGLDPEAIWIGWLGRVVPRKGALDFLRALADLEAGAGDRPVRLLLAGSAGVSRRERRYLGEIEAFLAGRPALRGRTLRVSDPEARPRLVESLDVLVVPSYWEGCSRVVLEGMRAACAIVAYASGGTPEMVAEGESALLVPAGDFGGLQAAVGRLIRDPSLARRLGGAARQRVRERYTLERHVEAVEAVFREVACGGAAAGAG